MRDRWRVRFRWIFAPAVAAILTVTGCAAGASSSPPAAAPTTAPPAATSTSAPAAAATSASGQVTPTSESKESGESYTVMVRDDPKLGKILVGSTGMTLYRYTKDGMNASACAGQCAKNWPPLAASDNPTLADDVAGKLGAITRGDGIKQVTYNGMPLYYYAKDGKPGDTTGQGVGGIWYVVTPGSGASASAASTASTPTGNGY